MCGYMCTQASALQTIWMNVSQKNREKQTDKPLRTVTLNITSSPVLQYSLITPKCPFISPQLCITKKALMAVW